MLYHQYYLKITIALTQHGIYARQMYSSELYKHTSHETKDSSIFSFLPITLRYGIQNSFKKAIVLANIVFLNP